MKPTQLNDGMKITWSQESANIGTFKWLSEHDDLHVGKVDRAEQR